MTMTLKDAITKIIQGPVSYEYYDETTEEDFNFDKEDDSVFFEEAEVISPATKGWTFDDIDTSIEDDDPGEMYKVNKDYRIQYP